MRQISGKWDGSVNWDTEDFSSFKSSLGTIVAESYHAMTDG